MSDKALLIFTPFLLTEPRHLAMAEAQARLAARLRPHLGVEVYSLAVVDGFDESSWTKAASAALSGFDYRRSVSRPPSGIVAPTLRALEVARQDFNTDKLYVARVIQDCFVTDARALALKWNQILNTASGRWLAGKVELVTKEDDLEKVGRWRGYAGLHLQTPMRHAQGALLLAPYTTWEQLYIMPEGLTHHYDDVIFSQLVEERGGQLRDVGGRWHTHDHYASEEQVRTRYLNPERPAPAGVADDAVRLLPLSRLLTSVLDETWAQVGGRPLFVLETGSVRSETPEDGHSTVALAWWARDRGARGVHTFVSVDLETGVAERLLKREGLDGFVSFWRGDSRELLRRVDRPVDVALLDSADDPAVALEEFKLLEPHLLATSAVLVDDFVTKGAHVLPYATGRGWRWTPLDRTALLRRVK